VLLSVLVGACESTGVDRPKPIEHTIGDWAEPLGEAGYGGLPLKVRDRHTKLVFMLVPPGLVVVASDESDESDSWRRGVWITARVTRPFYIAQREVSQSAWVKVMGTNPSTVRRGDDLPVESFDEKEVSRFLQRTGFRLPAEAEWLLAASGADRPGAQVPIDDYAWSLENLEAYWKEQGRPTESGSFEGPAPCGLLKPNSLGLYDTLGNVAEMCADWHKKLDPIWGLQADPTGPAESTLNGRVIRGGRYSDSGRSISLRWRSGQYDVGPDEIGLRPVRDP